MISHVANLRVFAMLAGLFSHTILFLVPAEFYPWQIKSSVSASWASVVVLYIYAFQTGIFFNLAGYFGKYLYQKLGTWRFLQERCIRVGLPFLFSMGISIFGYLPYVISTYYKGGGMAIFNPFLASLTFTGTFWFLYYLCWFYLLMAGGGNYLLNYLSHQLIKYFSRCSSTVLLLYTSFILGSFMLVILLAAQTASIIPSLTLAIHWDFFYYFLFFCGGWLGYKNHLVSRLAAINYSWLIIVATGIIFPIFSFLLFFVWPYHQSIGLRIIINLLEVANSVCMLFGIYSAFYHYLNRYIQALNFSARASFWCYYAQYPIVIMLQTCLLPTTLPTGFKVLGIFAGTLAILLLSYGAWEKTKTRSTLKTRLSLFPASNTEKNLN